MTQNTAREQTHIISLNVLKYTDNPTLYQQDLCQSLYYLPVLLKVCDGSAILSPLRARIGLVKKHKTSIDSTVCALVNLTEMMCDDVWLHGWSERALISERHKKGECRHFEAGLKQKTFMGWTQIFGLETQSNTKSALVVLQTSLPQPVPNRRNR